MTIVTEEGIDVLFYVNDKLVLQEEMKGLSDLDVDSFEFGVNGIFDNEEGPDRPNCWTEVHISNRGVKYGGRIVLNIHTWKGSELHQFVSKFGIQRLWEYIEADSFMAFVYPKSIKEEEDDTERYLLKKIKV